MMDEDSLGIIPDEIKGWNWGAFMFNITWGFGNKSYLPLLCLVPLFNIVWVFVCGFKGNEWAWQKCDHKDIEIFQAVQKSWNRAGLVAFVIAIIFIVLYFVFIAALVSVFVNDYYNY